MTATLKKPRTPPGDAHARSRRGTAALVNPAGTPEGRTRGRKESDRMIVRRRRTGKNKKR